MSVLVLPCFSFALTGAAAFGAIVVAACVVMASSQHGSTQNVRLPRERPSQCGDLLLGEKIGEGHYGSVFVGSSASRPEAVAVKVVRDASSAVGECMAELAHLRHKNLIDILEVKAMRRGRRCCLWVLMRFCGNEDLFSYAGRLDSSLTLKVARELVSAVAYLHRRGYIHRDIKPENVGMVPDARMRRLVLFDLGSMRPEGMVHWSEGTPQYQPPEVRGRRRVVVRASTDDWATGATLATVITNRHVLTQVHCRRAHQAAVGPVQQVVLWWCCSLLVPDLSARASVRALRRQVFGDLEF